MSGKYTNLSSGYEQWNINIVAVNDEPQFL